MLILNKRKIIIIVGIFIIATVFVQIWLTQIISKKNVYETSAIPANKKTIVLDAGHGGEDRRCNHRRPVYQKQLLI